MRWRVGGIGIGNDEVVRSLNFFFWRGMDDVGLKWELGEVPRDL